MKDQGNQNALAIIYDRPKTITFMDNNAVCRYDEKTGLLKGILVDVTLKESKGHMYNMITYKRNGYKSDGSPKFDKIDNWRATADAYDYANSIASLTVIREEKFQLNGKEVTNPFVEFDDNGKKSKVYCQCTVCGYAPDGTIKFSRALIIYDAKDVFVTELMSKITQYDKLSQQEKENTKAPGYLAVRETYEEDRKTNKSLVFYDVDGVVGVVADLTNSDVMKVYQNYQNKKENVERTVQTIARRNAFRRHPAITFYALSPKPTSDGDNVATVKIMKWVNGDNDLEKAVEEYMSGSIDIDSDTEVGKFENQDAGFEGDETNVDIEVEDIIDVDDLPEELSDEVEIDHEAVDVILDESEKEEKENLLNWILNHQFDVTKDGTKLTPEQRDELFGEKPNKEKTILELEVVVANMKKLIGGNLNEDNTNID